MTAALRYSPGRRARTCSSSAAVSAPRTTTSRPPASPSALGVGLDEAPRGARDGGGARARRRRAARTSTSTSCSRWRAARRCCRPAPRPCRRPASRPASPRAAAARASSRFPACPTSSRRCGVDVPSDLRRPRGSSPTSPCASCASSASASSQVGARARRHAARSARDRHQRRRGRGHGAAALPARRRRADGAGRRPSSPRSRPACPVFSSDGRTVDDLVADGLRARGLTLAVAESCTGGLLGRAAHRAAGQLGLLPRRRHQLRQRGQDGPARRAAGHARRSTAPCPRRSPARWPRARAPRLAPTTLWRVTGVAGPDGGTPDKPVGPRLRGAAAGRAGTRVVREPLPGRPRHGARLQRRTRALHLLRDDARRREPGGAPTSATLRLFVACDLPDATRRAHRGLAAPGARSPRRPAPEPRAAPHPGVSRRRAGRTRVPRAHRGALAACRASPARIAVAEPLFLPGTRRQARRRAGARRRATARSRGFRPDVTRGARRHAASTSRRERPLAARTSRSPASAVPVTRFPCKTSTSRSFVSSAMVLYSSLLERAGAVHTPLAVFPAS